MLHLCLNCLWMLMYFGLVATAPMDSEASPAKMEVLPKRFDDHIGSWHMFDHRSHALDLKAL
jgi:hypothetical protein